MREHWFDSPDEAPVDSDDLYVQESRNGQTPWWDGLEGSDGPNDVSTNRREIRRRPRHRIAAAIASVAASLVLVLVFVTLSGQGRGQSDDTALADDARLGRTATSSSTPAATPPPSSSPRPIPTNAAPSDPEAADLLLSIPVKGRAPRTGYDREGMFGAPWMDWDVNGCDTRNDILARDLTDKKMADPCRVLAGVLFDPFTGVVINFERGYESSGLVQIDHVVPLSNAWQTGAQQITQSQRIAFANDPLNLLAVDGAANQQKSDGDAATWLPPQKSFRCAYVARQVSVKAKYGLWVTQPERDAIARILSSCPGQPAFVS